jgi:hypothetical protein
VKQRYEKMPDGNWVANPHEGGGERVAPGRLTQRGAS